jgi:hypothetical protein
MEQAVMDKQTNTSDFIEDTYIFIDLCRKLITYNQSDQVKEDEISKACSTHGGEEECVQGFGGKIRRKETSMKT